MIVCVSMRRKYKWILIVISLYSNSEMSYCMIADNCSFCKSYLVYSLNSYFFFVIIKDFIIYLPVL